jgi:hypothetical protein
VTLRRILSLSAGTSRSGIPGYATAQPEPRRLVGTRCLVRQKARDFSFGHGARLLRFGVRFLLFSPAGRHCLVTSAVQLATPSRF